MTGVDIGVAFSLGLAGGLHCLQMCGPIVLSFSLPLARPDAIRAHLAYNAGRLLTYATLGALTGWAGAALGLLGRLAGLASAARIATGILMILIGLLTIGFVPKNPLIHLGRPNLTSRLRTVAARLLLAPGVGRKFRLGVALGFLPCGLIYAALLKAMETATPVAGAVTMLAFGSGTAIALLALGLSGTLASLHLGRWPTRLAPAAILIFGVILLYRGLSAPLVCHG